MERKHQETCEESCAITGCAAANDTQGTAYALPGTALSRQESVDERLPAVAKSIAIRIGESRKEEARQPDRDHRLAYIHRTDPKRCDDI